MYIYINKYTYKCLYITYIYICTYAHPICSMVLEDLPTARTKSPSFEHMGTYIYIYICIIIIFPLKNDYSHGFLTTNP